MADPNNPYAKYAAPSLSAPTEQYPSFPSSHQPLIKGEETGVAPSHSDDDTEFTAFNQNRSCRDIFFLILFLLFLVGMGVVSGFAFAAGDPSKIPSLPDFAKTYLEKFIENWINHGAMVFGISLGVAVILAFIWLELLKRCTACFIYSSIGLAILALFAGAGYLLFTAYGASNPPDSTMAAFGFVLLAAGVIVLFGACLIRKKIALTAAMMKEGCKGLQNRSGLLFVVLVLLAIFAAFFAYFAITFVYMWTVPSAPSPAPAEAAFTRLVNGVPVSVPVEFNRNIRWFVLFMVFMAFWVVETLMAIYTASVAGAVASWYFDRNASKQPLLPSLRAFGFAMTKSLGSLSLGALIVAILDFVQYLLAKAQKAAEKTNNRLLKCLLCCCVCTAACVRSCVQWVNKWAYIYIAMYGTGFCTSARKACELIGRNTFSSVVIDGLTNFVVLSGEIFGAAFIAALAVLLSRFTGDYSVNMVNIALIAIAAFLIFRMVGATVGRSVDTVFMCYLEDMERNTGSGRYCTSPELQETLGSLKPRPGATIV